MNNFFMPDVNYVIIAGNVIREPTLRRTTNGTPVTNFWIASSRKFKDNIGMWRKNICYVGVVAWYKLAENCAATLSRGNAVIIEGELQSRKVVAENEKSRTIVEIKARRIQVLNKIVHEGQSTVSEEMEEEIIESDQNEQTIKEEFEDEENPMKGKFDFGYQDLKL